jgi:anti-anti-sigma factor
LSCFERSRALPSPALPAIAPNWSRNRNDRILTNFQSFLARFGTKPASRVADEERWCGQFRGPNPAAGTPVENMAILLSHNDHTLTIALEGSIDIGAAAELKAALLDALLAGKNVCLSLSRVTDLDVTAFQLLWAAEREAEQTGARLALAGPLQEPVRTGLAALALSGLAVSE